MSAISSKHESQILEQLIKEAALEKIPFALVDIEKLKEGLSESVTQINYPVENEFRMFWLIYDMYECRFSKIEYKDNGKDKEIEL